MLNQVPKTFNARFEKEVFYAIADLLEAKYGRDKTEAVGRAILEARERLNGVPNAVAQPGYGADSREKGSRQMTGPDEPKLK